MHRVITGIVALAAVSSPPTRVEKVGGATAVPAGRNKVYAMYCYECGFRVRKRGIPSRKPIQDS
jgi:hypothetical protein